MGGGGGGGGSFSFSTCNLVRGVARRLLLVKNDNIVSGGVHFTAGKNLFTAVSGPASNSRLKVHRSYNF